MEMQQMIGRLLAGQEQMIAERRADQSKAEADQEQMKEMMESEIGSLVSRMEADRKNDGEEMKQEIRAGQEHLMTTINAYHERNMAVLGKTEAKDLKVNPEEIEPDSEHREVPQEVAAVKSSGTMKKRHRDRHLAAGRCGKPKELTRGDCGSRRKLAAACRKVSRRARASWHSRNTAREYIRAKVERGIRTVRTRHEGGNGMKGLGLAPLIH
jgi:hypothetical protein